MPYAIAVNFKLYIHNVVPEISCLSFTARTRKSLSPRVKCYV